MGADDIKLNLGCGPHFLDGWRNYDIEGQALPTDRSVHFKMIDLRGGLPIATGDASYVFSEHFIEHVTRDAALGIAAECFRVLRPGGVLRLSTPNLRYLVTCYVKGRLTDWAPTWMPQTPCQLLNEGMRLWGHRYVYDYAELQTLLHEVGFADVYPVNWHESSHEALRELEVRPYHSDLIVEAVRP